MFKRKLELATELERIIKGSYHVHRSSLHENDTLASARYKNNIKMN